jgi:hypothetical protein
MSDAALLKTAQALVANGYIMAIALAVGIAFGAAWALIPLVIGLVIFLAA